MPRIAKHMPRDPAGETRKAALAAKLKELRGRRRALNTQIRHLEKLWASKRPWHHCERCGHEWRGIHFNVVPTHCSRCHSAGWNKQVKMPKRARKPTDAPHPRWETRNVKKVKVVPDVPNAPVPITVPIGSPMVHVATVEEGELYIAPDDLMDKLRARLVLPAGLPPPPSVEAYSTPLFIPKSPVITEMEEALRAYFPPPPSLTPPEPQLYRPRPAEEPQPEGYSRQAFENDQMGQSGADNAEKLNPPPAPPEEPEPDWEAILPKISLEFDEDAARGEEAWLAGN